jgi:hypothetical protein
MQASYAPESTCRAALTAAMIGLALLASAQWSADPAAPMVVCAAPNDQRFLSAIADADSGYFVFWSDQRVLQGRGQLYGQHFDSEGHALWTANGKLLWDQPGRSIHQTAPLLVSDGSLIVAFTTGPSVPTADTTRAMRFDVDGDPLWSSPVVLTNGTNSYEPILLPSGNKAYLMHNCWNCPGGGGYLLQRVDLDGNTDFPLPGAYRQVGQNGPFQARPDGAGGIMAAIRNSNALGTGLWAARFDSLGAAAWPAVLIHGTNGLSYDFIMDVDDDGKMVAAWESNGDVKMNRVDTLSDQLWSPPVQDACTASSIQQAPDLAMSEGAFHVSWLDNRTDSVGLYAQRFDPATGDPVWNSTGILVHEAAYAVDFSTAVPSDSSSVIAIMAASSTEKFCAMRLRADGSMAWDEMVSFTTAHVPNMDEHLELPDGSGGVTAFWLSAALGGGLHGARIYRNGKLYDDVGIRDMAERGALIIHPNPATDRITLKARSPLRAVQVLAMDGRAVDLPIVLNGAEAAVDIGRLATGSYLVQATTPLGVLVQRFMKQ